MGEIIIDSFPLGFHHIGYGVEIPPNPLCHQVCGMFSALPPPVVLPLGLGIPGLGGGGAPLQRGGERERDVPTRSAGYKFIIGPPHFYRPRPGLLAICAILRICVILGWDYYTEILRQDLHPTTRVAPNRNKSSILRQDLHPTAIRVRQDLHPTAIRAASYDKTCTQPQKEFHPTATLAPNRYK